MNSTAFTRTSHSTTNSPIACIASSKRDHGFRQFPGPRHAQPANVALHPGRREGDQTMGGDHPQRATASRRFTRGAQRRRRAVQTRQPGPPSTRNQVQSQPDALYPDGEYLPLPQGLRDEPFEPART